MDLHSLAQVLFTASVRRLLSGKLIIDSLRWELLHTVASCTDLNPAYSREGKPSK